MGTGPQRARLPLYITPELRTEVPRLLYKRPGAAMDRTARDYEDYSPRAWPSLVALGDALDFQATIGSDASP